MISTIDHRLVTSFISYIDYQILSKGNSYTTISTGFYPYTGSRYTNLTIYASPFKQMISDVGITGATVITGVSGNNNLYNRASGVVFDYEKGRILFTTNPGLSQFSGSFSVKDVNIKYSTKSVEDVLKNTKYVTQPVTNQSVTGIAESVETYPIVFVNYTPGKNKGRALGGLEDTDFKFDCICVTNSQYLLDGLLGILRDLNKTQVGIFDNSETPLNASGDLKNTSYSYTGTTASKSWPNAFFITDVETFKIDNSVNNEYGQDIFIGEANFDCSLSRFPRL